MTSQAQLRPAAWLNTQNHQPVYGIEIFIHGMWIPMGDEGGFFLFDTKEIRDMAMEEHRATLNA